MTIHVDFSFPRHYSCDVLDEFPGASPVRYFPNGEAAGRDGVVVRVQPGAASAWLGLFAFGNTGESGVTRVLSMPNAEQICVVSQGAGYVVTAATPDLWEAVQATPIKDVVAVPGAGLVVFATFTEMLAYGVEGVKWRTKRLAWDGLKIVGVQNMTLIGEYWDIREESIQRFEVDLATGSSRGGVES